MALPYAMMAPPSGYNPDRVVPQLTCKRLTVTESLTISGTPLGNESVITTTAAPTLTGARTLDVNFPLTASDNGAGNTLEIGVDLTSDLAAVEGIASTGIAARTAGATWTTRTITATAGETTVGDGSGVGGNPTIGLANAGTPGTYNFPSAITTDAKGRVTSATSSGGDLAALEGLGTTGLVTRTAANTFTTRSIQVGSTQLSITNADGVAGAPSIDFAGLLVTKVTKSGTQSITHSTTTAFGSQTTITSWSGVLSGLSGFDTGTGVWTVPATATYCIFLHLEFGAGAAAGELRAYIVNTNTNAQLSSCFQDITGSGHAGMVDVYFMGALTVNHTIDFRAGQSQTGSAAKNVETGTSLYIIRLSS